MSSETSNMFSYCTSTWRSPGHFPWSGPEAPCACFFPLVHDCFRSVLSKFRLRLCRCSSLLLSISYQSLSNNATPWCSHSFPNSRSHYGTHIPTVIILNEKTGKGCPLVRFIEAVWSHRLVRILMRIPEKISIPRTAARLLLPQFISQCLVGFAPFDPVKDYRRECSREHRLAVLDY